MHTETMVKWGDVNMTTAGPTRAATSGLSTGEITGIVIAVTAVLTVCLTVLTLYLQNRRKTQDFTGSPDSSIPSTKVKISKWTLNVCGAITCSCCSCRYAPVPTNGSHDNTGPTTQGGDHVMINQPPASHGTSNQQLTASSDTESVSPPTTSAEPTLAETTNSITTAAEIHTRNVEPTAPPADILPGQSSLSQTAQQPPVSTSATTEVQSSSAGQTAQQPPVGAAAVTEAQLSSIIQTAQQPSVSTSATTEVQSSSAGQTAQQPPVGAAAVTEAQLSSIIQTAQLPPVSTAATTEVQSSSTKKIVNQQPLTSTVTREEQPSTIQDLVENGESQLTCPHPPSSTTTTEGQSSASQTGHQTPVSSTVTTEGHFSVSHDSTDIADSQQVLHQPPGSAAATVQPVSSELVSETQQPVPHRTEPHTSQPCNVMGDITDSSSAFTPKPRNPNLIVTTEHLQKLANGLAPWERLANVLGLSEADIYRLKVGNPFSVWTQAYDMLLKWKNRVYRNATVGVLVKKCQDADVGSNVYGFLLHVDV
ncbi:endochitinase 2-like isoform X4 [Acanthaster planci]|uniref:Endochitinase 2-like isoform X4 n=1 Tax=Acanthaster planci TaxID=133434 RepID=A0A8B8A4Y4_ACAPL|nr:endochitinase 2-like isoform X4 [Acanthaster planci]